MAAFIHLHLPHSSSPIRYSLPLLRSTRATQLISVSRLPCRKVRKLSICCSVNPENEEDSLTESFVSSVTDDSEYLWKLAAGSAGGASAIKYGSVLLPEITRPNIIKGLLMVSLPMLVAALILFKESYTQRPHEDFL